MTLQEYLDDLGPRAIDKLRDQMEACGDKALRWATIYDIARGKSSPLAETAKRIERATGGAVTAAELLGLTEPESDAAE